MSDLDFSLCALDDLQLIARTLDHDAAASRELMRRYNSALREAARDANARISDSDIETAIAELWRSLMADEMRALRAFTPVRGARILSWLTIRLARLVWSSADEEISSATLMKVEEVAQRWGVDRKTIYSMISRGQLSARRCGRLVRIPRNVVESFELQASVSPARSAPCR